MNGTLRAAEPESWEVAKPGAVFRFTSIYNEILPTADETIYTELLLGFVCIFLILLERQERADKGIAK